MHRIVGPAFALVALITFANEGTLSAQTPVYSPVPAVSPGVAESSVGSESYFCAKCRKYHAHPASGAVSANQQVAIQSAGSPTFSPQPAFSPQSAAEQNRAVSRGTGLRGTGVVQNVLAILNGQRSRQGIGSLRYDPALQAVAERRAQAMASMSLKSHPPGSFAPGTYEGVGWSSSYSPSGVSACFTSDTRMQVAGAAMATGRDGVYFAVVYR